MASSFFCTDAKVEEQGEDASVCFGGIARGYCTEVDNAPGCPMLQPVGAGLCGVASNLRSNFPGNFSESIGISYSPMSMCLGVGSSGLTAANGGGYPTLTSTCVQAECSSNGRSYEIVLSTGDSGSEQRHQCPEGETVQLGESDGFAQGVRAWSLAALRDEPSRFCSPRMQVDGRGLLSDSKRCCSTPFCTLAMLKHQTCT